VLILIYKIKNSDIVLILAARNGYKKIVELFISLNTDVNTKNKYDSSVLQIAKNHKNENMINLLKDVGVKD